MPVDFISVLLFVGMAQCLFLLIVIALGRTGQKLANQLLFILILTFLWYQFEFFLLRNTLEAQIPFIYSTRYGSWLLVGPLILLYNRAILIKDYRINLKDYLHFLPFLLFTILFPIGFGGMITDRATHYGMLTVFDSWNQEPITSWHYFYGFIFVIQFLHAVVYIAFAFRQTKKLEALAKDRSTTLDLDKLNTLRYLYLAAIFIICLCSFFVIYQFLTTMWRRNFDYLYVLPTLIFVFGLAYRAMRFPNSVLVISEEIQTQKYAKSGLTEKAKDSLLEKLLQKLEEEKIYRDNDLRLSDLADSLNVSTHHLSQLINEKLNQNFFDLINAYRIRDAKEQIANGISQTLLQIALQVGFNNKNSFNTAFKKHAGMTPSAFKKLV